MSDLRWPLVSPFTRRMLSRVAIGAAVVGVALGIETLVYHLSTDPFADTRLYYDAATRLNEGLPLYVPSTTPGVGPYVSPPLLAIAFRPLALLPFPLAAAIWELILVGALGLTIGRIGTSRPVLIALGCLALPTLWALSVGQAEVLVTLFLAIGSPLSVATAGYLKLFPWLVAVYWIGRRDTRHLARWGAWIAGLGVLQLVLAPAATLDYLRLTWLQGQFDFRSISPFVIHPALWVILVLVLLVASLRLSPTRYGWAAAVSFAVLASPRLLTYQLMSLIAAFGGSYRGVDRVPARDDPPVPVTERTAGL